MEDVASRIDSRIHRWSQAYAEAVEGAFGMDVDYEMLIKLYGWDSFNTKYSPDECIGTQSKFHKAIPIQKSTLARRL